MFYVAFMWIYWLSRNLEQQDKVYQENPEASIAILKKLYDDWKEVSVKLAPLDPLRETLKNFRQKVDT